MALKSIELGHLPVMGMGSAMIKSQFRTKIQQAPAGTNLAGQVAIVTGASAGLGLQCSKQLLSLKLSRLILAVRSPQKGEAAAKTLRTAYPSARIDVWSLEMTSYPSIQTFCQRIVEELSRLDLVILNAGCTNMNFTLCPETGHEEVVQVNYLSTFLLAILLLPVLRQKRPNQTTPGRLTIVSSGVALYAKLPNRDHRPLLPSFDDTTVTPYDPSERYFASKTLGHLFFARMLDYLNDDVVVNLVDPGLCKGSELHRNAKGVIRLVMSVSKLLTGRTLEEGAWTYIDAAVVKGKESNGCFVSDWEIAPFSSLVYEAKSQGIIDALWDETLAELQFAGVRQILEKYKKGGD